MDVGPDGGRHGDHHVLLLPYEDVAAIQAENHKAEPEAAMPERDDEPTPEETDEHVQGNNGLDGRRPRRRPTNTPESFRSYCFPLFCSYYLVF